MATSGPRPEAWPLFDLRVDLLANDRSRLYLCCSLLIADSWSFNLFFRHLRALLDHRPQTFRGDVLLFRAAETAPRNSHLGMGVDDAQETEHLGWTDHVDGRIEQIMVPGHHYNVIQAPAVKKVAEALKEALQKRGTR